MTKRWSDISGQMKIFVNEFEGRKSFSTTVSNKKEDGTYENMFVPVQFSKSRIDDNTIANKSDIIVNSGFFSFYTSKDGKQVLKIIITDIEQADFISVADEDLPF